MNVKEVAKYLFISQAHVKVLLERGDLTGALADNGQYLVDDASVEHHRARLAESEKRVRPLPCGARCLQSLNLVYSYRDHAGRPLTVGPPSSDLARARVRAFSLKHWLGRCRRRGTS
jgi:hypothetical protein